MVLGHVHFSRLTLLQELLWSDNVKERLFGTSSKEGGWGVNEYDAVLKNLKNGMGGSGGGPPFPAWHKTSFAPHHHLPTPSVL